MGGGCADGGGGVLQWVGIDSLLLHGDGGGGVLQWVGIDSMLLHGRWEGVVLMVFHVLRKGMSIVFLVRGIVYLDYAIMQRNDLGFLLVIG